jgi:lantibiotic transport system permease protein
MTMSFLISSRAELIKTKRSATVWVVVLGSGFIPLIFLLIYTLSPEKNYPRLQMFPWEQHFSMGWQALASFLLPMFVILICSLIPQIEYKNNGWKQSFSSPQSIGNIFFSKFLTIHIMIIILFILFNIFLIGSALISNWINPNYVFLKNPINWGSLLKLDLKTYLSVLGMSAIQYWLSLRFKNFIAAIGIGLALLISSLISIPFWENVDKLPYAYPILTMKNFASGSKGIQRHEIYSIAYFAGFLLLAFLDMKYRKERG